MPVLQVFARPLDDTRGALDAVCREVATALGLQPADVVATFIAVSDTVVPGHDDDSWPVVVIHGSARDGAAMADACDRVRRLAAGWSGSGEAWVTWQLPR